MTITFRFHNHIRKDGTRQLLVRLRTRDREANIPIEGLLIEEKYWSKATQLVSVKHPMHTIFNNKLIEYHQKIKTVQTLYNTREIDFEQAKLMINAKSAVDSISTYIEIYCHYKSGQWHRNTRCALNGLNNYAGLNKVDLQFEDVNRINILKMRSVMLEKGRQPDTFNSYLAHIKAVYNLALLDKVIYRQFGFERLGLKTDKHSKKLITHSSEEIYDAIARIKIESNHRSAREKALRCFEAVGFWMLKFCMRGGYGMYVSTLTGDNIDYDTKAARKFMQNANTSGSLTLKGNAHFITHKRHKTGAPMYIWFNLPPMGGLIYMLRRLTAITHPKLAYLQVQDFNDPNGGLLEKIDNDLLKIFTHNPRIEIGRDNAIWNNLNKRLKDIGLSSFETARKTYSTTARILGISDGIKMELMGQTDDSIQRHYDNYNDPELVLKTQQAHLQIMHKFQMVELFDFWISKLSQVMKVDYTEMMVGAPSNLVYTQAAQKLPDIIGVNQVEIRKDKAFKAVFDLPRQQDLFKNGGTIRLRT